MELYGVIAEVFFIVQEVVHGDFVGEVFVGGHCGPFHDLRGRHKSAFHRHGYFGTFGVACVERYSECIGDTVKAESFSHLYVRLSAAFVCVFEVCFSIRMGCQSHVVDRRDTCEFPAGGELVGLLNMSLRYFYFYLQRAGKIIEFSSYSRYAVFQTR